MGLARQAAQARDFGNEHVAHLAGRHQLARLLHLGALRVAALAGAALLTYYIRSAPAPAFAHRLQIGDLARPVLGELGDAGENDGELYHKKLVLSPLQNGA